MTSAIRAVDLADVADIAAPVALKGCRVVAPDLTDITPGALGACAMLI